MFSPATNFYHDALCTQFGRTVHYHIEAGRSVHGHPLFQRRYFPRCRNLSGEKALRLPLAIWLIAHSVDNFLEVAAHRTPVIKEESTTYTS